MPSRLIPTACALKFLHDKNISHLDLKPQNILLSSLDKPHLKLAGWYEKRNFDIAFYFICVCVIPSLEALFGRPPFASRSFTELEEKIRSNQPIEVGLPLLETVADDGSDAGGGDESALGRFTLELKFGEDRPRLSPECRDLLQRLLKRDPQQRISFQAFFTHPFVDMEHMPSEESLGKAMKLMPEGRKRSDPRFNFLVEMSKDKPRLYAALEVASAAVAKEEEGKDDSETLELYQQSLGELLLMLAAEPAGRRRELLHAEIQMLMGRAEYLKEQIKMKESQWEAETIGKEGMSDSVKSCECDYVSPDVANQSSLSVYQSVNGSCKVISAFTKPCMYSIGTLDFFT
ncbi:hypothetical protein JD844_014297 [Phrynosoma platyrhinos]|uniref:Serine/threonine-protein kinase ULK3 n=1 Tax=Phrynosoma platyrhinos TaxID=52577 RepID=A0ABQ7SRD2_PHRPL|nr:hypothetical protein JD844_014297 [Phrynosoma platyrhinos]